MIIVSKQNDDKIQVLYSARSFEINLNITAYLIYPDLTKSDIIIFSELGDGIYAGLFNLDLSKGRHIMKCGVLIKEGNIPSLFDIIEIIVG